eukprot:TRINITY_DN15940_c0_g2_i1.p2 TRINITY_DN15940_c0_g2~~TRINITY_DN15940_c0_g2_i1.p2  ORF type:complete len:206 (-),score=27.17 TRINITY_DN15940_c0_g2_i1:65-682(-)
MALLLIGVTIALSAQFSYMSEFDPRSAYHLRGGQPLQPTACALIMVASVVVSTIEGQTKEMLIHAHGFDSLAVQMSSSVGSVLLSLMLILPMLFIESLAPQHLYRIVSHVSYALLLSAAYKASDQLVGIKLVELANYTWKKAAGAFKVVPATLLEAWCYYAIRDTIMCRPLGLQDAAILVGLAFCFAGLCLESGSFRSANGTCSA